MELPPLEVTIPWVPEAHQPAALAVVLGLIGFSFFVRWMNTLAARFQRCKGCGRAFPRTTVACPACGAVPASPEARPEP